MFFLQPAKGITRPYAYVMTIAGVFSAYLFGQIPLLLALAPAFMEDPATDPYEIFQSLDSLTFFTLAMLMFVFSFFALLVLIKFLHKRSWLTLISPYKNIDFKRILISGGVWFGLLIVSFLIQYLIDPDLLSYDPPGGDFFILILLCLLFLPFQVGFEELFFRGYLMQSIGYHTGIKIVAVLGVSTIFMLMHLANPETAKYGLTSMTPYYFVASLVMCLIVVIDDRLEMAFGIHFVNNFAGLALVTYEGSVLPTDALFNIGELDVDSQAFISNLIIYIIFIVVISIIYNWSPRYIWTRLTEKIKKKDYEITDADH